MAPCLGLRGSARISAACRSSATCRCGSVFFGPADIAASFGHVGDPSHPEVCAAILEGMAHLEKKGVPSGILSLDQEFLGQAANAGASFIAVDVDSGLLRRAAVARRSEWADIR